MARIRWRPVWKRVARAPALANNLARGRLLPVVGSVVDALRANPGIGSRGLRAEVRRLRGQCSDAHTDAARVLLGTLCALAWAREATGTTHSTLCKRRPSFARTWRPASRPSCHPSDGKPPWRACGGRKHKPARHCVATVRLPKLERDGVRGPARHSRAWLENRLTGAAATVRLASQLLVSLPIAASECTRLGSSHRLGPRLTPISWSREGAAHVRYSDFG